jgi:hypothetical protein
MHAIIYCEAAGGHVPRCMMSYRPTIFFEEILPAGVRFSERLQTEDKNRRIPTLLA